MPCQKFQRHAFVFLSLGFLLIGRQADVVEADCCQHVGLHGCERDNVLSFDTADNLLRKADCILREIWTGMERCVGSGACGAQD